MGAQPGPGLRHGDRKALPGLSSSQSQGEEGGMTVDTTPVVLLPGHNHQATGKSPCFEHAPLSPSTAGLGWEAGLLGAMGACNRMV